MKAQMLTPWTGDGSGPESAFTPKIYEDYRTLSGTDVTAQPSANLTPNPNMLVIEVECDAATLTAIEADPAYFVLWSDA